MNYESVNTNQTVGNLIFEKKDQVKAIQLLRSVYGDAYELSKEADEYMTSVKEMRKKFPKPWKVSAVGWLAQGVIKVFGRDWKFQIEKDNPLDSRFVSKAGKAGITKLGPEKSINDFLDNNQGEAELMLIVVLAVGITILADTPTGAGAPIEVHDLYKNLCVKNKIESETILARMNESLSALKNVIDKVVEEQE